MKVQYNSFSTKKKQKHKHFQNLLSQYKQTSLTSKLQVHNIITLNYSLLKIQSINQY